MVFQLSNAVIQGLKNLDGIFSDELSKKLIANCVKLILNPSGSK